jgi:predicted nucleic acid-binding protein
VRVVIDANAVVALLAREPESEAVEQRIVRWAREGVELHAPALARYEAANVLTRKASMGEIEQEDLPVLWAELEAMPIVYHPLGDGAAVIDVAIELQRRSAYDAAYVALARELNAEL